ncbi:MAG: PHP domain-containing protein [Pontibacterium sp.]
MATVFPKYDLHSHTTASDGSLTPAELVSRAQDRSVKILSITDHDTLAGVKQLIAEGLPVDIRLIPGAELTVNWSGRMIHIIGLNMNPDLPEVHYYLSQLETLRNTRAEKIAARLIKAGVPDDHFLEQVKKEAGTGSIGRPHFAKVLVKLGVVNTEQAAFKDYLGAGKVGDVKMQWPDLQEAVDVIRLAGGYSVIAHPTKYKMTFTKIRTLVADFVAAGGSAMEVSYSGITPNHQVDLERLAAQAGLMVSAGSDFHSPAQTWTEVGKFPPVKDMSRHVLTQLL